MQYDAVMSEEARLIKTLAQRYEKIGKLARPVVNSSKPVKVSLSLMLYQLINVDESEQFITLKFWIHTVLYAVIYKLHSLFAERQQADSQTVAHVSSYWFVHLGVWEY